MILSEFVYVLNNKVNIIILMKVITSRQHRKQSYKIQAEKLT